MDIQQLDQNEILINKDEDGDPIELGKGSAGVVYQGRYCNSMPVAVKKVDKCVVAERELKMYRLLTHPNVIRLIGHYTKKNYLFLVLELGSCNLRQFLESRSADRLEFCKALVFALQISEAISFLHGQDIIHLDIKSSNIIICNGIAKISDLGTARMMIATNTQSITLGRTGRGRYSQGLLSLEFILKFTL